MALTHLKVKISNPGNAQKAQALDFLIDSGATYSAVDAITLKQLGIRPEEEREFILANGQNIKRKLGGARFEFGGHIGFAPVIFGEKGDGLLLGATALEAMGFALNPLKRELMPLPMLLG